METIKRDTRHGYDVFKSCHRPFKIIRMFEALPTKAEADKQCKKLQDDFDIFNVQQEEWDFFTYYYVKPRPTHDWITNECWEQSPNEIKSFDRDARKCPHCNAIRPECYDAEYHKLSLDEDKVAGQSCTVCGGTLPDLWAYYRNMVSSGMSEFDRYDYLEDCYD